MTREAFPDLAALFGARSVAIVGASERNHYAHTVFLNLRRLGYPAEAIHPVNPGRAEAFGLRCVPRLIDLPESVDLALVATPAATVLGVVRDCGARGIPSAVILSDGFAEQGTDGAALQVEVAAAARDGGVLLCGPNTMGFVAPGAGLGVWGGELPEGLRDGAAAAVFQSSGLLNLFLGLASPRGVGFHAAVSVGNQAGLTTADYLHHLAGDEATRVIVAFVEAVGDAGRFVAALDRCAALGKPVIALRAGRSERARRNIVAHTGSLASSGAAWDALFAQKGVVTVGNVDELLETTILFARAGGTPATGGIGLVTISGGDCTLLSDIGERVGAPIAEPSEATTAAIREALHRPNVLANPLDVENSLRTDPPAFRRCVELLAADDAFAVLAYRFNLTARPTDELRAGYRFMAETARAHGRLPVFLSRAAESLDRSWHDLFGELEAPFLQEYETALGALTALLAFRARPSRPAVSPTIDVARAARARALLATTAERALGHAETAALLDLYGIPRAPDVLARDPAETAAAAERIGGPVAVKIVSRDLPHKTEAGAVRLDVRTADEARGAAAELLAAARAMRPDARIDGIQVQRMERGVAECIAGLSRDPQLGLVVVAGFGGIFVEILRDAALRIPPLDEPEARAMVRSLRGLPLLEGARGRPAGDLDAFVDVLLRLSSLALEVGDELDAIDLNPVIVRTAGRGVAAVDALALRHASPALP